MYVLLVTLLLFVHEGLTADKGYEYHHIGCFEDKADRAMPYLATYLFEPIRHCAERAKKDGFRTFGIQFGNQCYGGPVASTTYNKYGPSEDCSSGVGGSWANDVYQYPEYIHVGCYKDEGDSRAFPDYLGTFPSKEVVQKCAAISEQKHYPIFGVQNSDECWTGPKSEQDFGKYGAGTGCENGVGGKWLNDVYSRERYHNVGCFKDKLLFRAIPLPWGVFHTVYPDKTAVANCAAHAESKHAIGFAVQHDVLGRQCYYIKDKDVDYDKYGKSDACGGGVGGSFANDVYMFY